MPHTKKCVKCGKDKKLADFYKDSKLKNGYTSYCKDCHKIYNKLWREKNTYWKQRLKDYKKTPAGQLTTLKTRVKKFGITVEDYYELKEKQNGRCAICGGKDVANRDLAIDHNHQTGTVRGLLCVHCNCLLGNAKDDIYTLQCAIDYLMTHKEI